jgi:hypothetical protein
MQSDLLFCISVLMRRISKVNDARSALLDERVSPLGLNPSPLGAIREACPHVALLSSEEQGNGKRQTGARGRRECEW